MSHVSKILQHFFLEKDDIPTQVIWNKQNILFDKFNLHNIKNTHIYFTFHFLCWHNYIETEKRKHMRDTITMTT